MQIVASIIQALGLAFAFVSLWMLGGVWVFVLGGSLFTTAVGFTIEKQQRQRTR